MSQTMMANDSPIRLPLDMSALDLARFVGGHTVGLTFHGVVIGTLAPLGGRQRTARAVGTTRAPAADNPNMTRALALLESASRK